MDFEYERRQHDMLKRFAALAGVCLLAPMGAAPLALADPPADPNVAPAANVGPQGPGPSAAPGVL